MCGSVNLNQVVQKALSIYAKGEEEECAEKKQRDGSSGLGKEVIHRGERLKFTSTAISSAILFRTILGMGISCAAVAIENLD